MSRITMRFDEGLAAQIDAAASGCGMSRSAFLKAMIARQLEAAPLQSKPGQADRDGRVVLRMVLPAKLYRALKSHADQLHIKPADYLRRMAQARFYQGEEPLIQIPKITKEITKSIEALNRIGRNINDAVRSIHGAAAAQNNPEMQLAIKDILAMRDALRMRIDQHEDKMIGIISAVNRYWL